MKYWFMPGYVCRNNLVRTILGVAIATSYAFGSGSDGGKNQPPNPNPFPGLSLKIPNATVPPGGVYQLQVMVTEPKPVGAGSPGFTLDGSVFGTGEGASVNDPSGEACGVAVRTLNGFHVTLLSPNATLGTNGDAAIMTIVLPVRPDAQVGLQVPVNFDLSSNVFLDSTGLPYPLQM